MHHREQWKAVIIVAKTLIELKKQKKKHFDYYLQALYTGKIKYYVTIIICIIIRINESIKSIFVPIKFVWKHAFDVVHYVICLSNPKIACSLRRHRSNKHNLSQYYEIEIGLLILMQTFIVSTFEWLSTEQRFLGKIDSIKSITKNLLDRIAYGM